MDKSHQKHGKIGKPDLGFFGRNEWAIIGAPCSIIQDLANRLTSLLASQLKLAYIDAEHNESESSSFADHAIHQGMFFTYTDKIKFHQFNLKGHLDSFKFRSYLQDQDLILVNGNHFTAKRQIVILDPRKEESLSRKLDRLSQVDLILLTDTGKQIYSFLDEHLKGRPQPMMMELHDTEKIAQFLLDKYYSAIPSVFGLVLAGGKSTRMGEDKGSIVYHNEPQRLVAARLLSNFCEKVWLSGRPGQFADNMESDFPVLEDQLLEMGPFGALISAFMRFPNQAWMVIACDLPLLDEITLDFLLKHRDPSAIATAFNSPENEFPEPLIAIWEPKSYPVLLQFMAQGYSCPRKVLINNPVKLLNAPDPKKLANVNHPEEKQQMLNWLARKS